MTHISRHDFNGLTFIDLFAGIGGIRLAFEANGCRCVFSSEWDLKAQTTYRDNFGETPAGDITKIQDGDIPDHDILLAGFPETYRITMSHADIRRQTGNSVAVPMVKAVAERVVQSLLHRYEAHPVTQFVLF